MISFLNSLIFARTDATDSPYEKRKIHKTQAEKQTTEHSPIMLVRERRSSRGVCSLYANNDIAFKVTQLTLPQETVINTAQNLSRRKVNQTNESLLSQTSGKVYVRQFFPDADRLGFWKAVNVPSLNEFERKNTQDFALPKPAIKRYTSDKKIFQQVLKELGEHLPERGGLLGGNRATGEITKFWLDRAPLTANYSTYEPNVQAVNKQLNFWNSQGIELIGMIHSHPGGFNRPSIADSLYARDILQAIPAMQNFFMPIVLTKPQSGKASIYSYVVSRSNRNAYDKCDWVCE